MFKELRKELKSLSEEVELSASTGQEVDLDELNEDDEEVEEVSADEQTLEEIVRYSKMKLLKWEQKMLNA